MRRHDLTGKRYGHLVIQEFSHTKNARAYWNCLCVCGKTVTVIANALRQGLRSSCGCKTVERMKAKRWPNRVQFGIISIDFEKKGASFSKRFVPLDVLRQAVALLEKGAVS